MHSFTLAEVNQKVAKNIDDYGLIVHFQNGTFNGGDSCQRTCSYYVFNHFLRDGFPSHLGFSRALKYLQAGDEFIRHPEKGYNCGKPNYTIYECWSEPKNFSCDQSRALIVALQFYARVSLARKFAVNTLKNFSRFQNNDLCWLPEWGAMIRACGLWWLWPLLLLCDAWLVLSNTLAVFTYFVSLVRHDETKGRYMYTDGHVTGVVLSLSTREMPTPFGWLARKIIKIRCVEAWDYYFRHEGAPKLNLYIPLIKGKL